MHGCPAEKRLVLLPAEAIASRLELVHGDLCGPITLATPGGKKFFLLMVDDYSRYMWMELLPSKGYAPGGHQPCPQAAEALPAQAELLRDDRGVHLRRLHRALCHHRSLSPTHCTILAVAERSGGLANRSSWAPLEACSRRRASLDIFGDRPWRRRCISSTTRRRRAWRG